MSQCTWSAEDTFELIKLYETNTLLWDRNNREFWNKKAKTEIINDIAKSMNVTPEEVIRKWHNLRNQLCQEIKRLKRKKFKGKRMLSGWRYFSAMKFLNPVIIYPKKLLKEKNIMELNAEEYKDLDEMERRRERKISAKFLNGHYKEEPRYSLRHLAKIPEYEETDTMEYKGLDGIEERQKICTKFLSSTYDEEPKHSLRPKAPDDERSTMQYRDLDEVEDTRKMKIPNKYANISYDEEPRHSLRIHPLSKLPDENDRFGEYVALELRSLRSEANKRRLKSEIRRAICRIADLEDADILNPSELSNSLFPYPQPSPMYSQICEITNITSENV